MSDIFEIEEPIIGVEKEGEIPPEEPIPAPKPKRKGGKTKKEMTPDDKKAMLERLKKGRETALANRIRKKELKEMETSNKKEEEDKKLHEFKQKKKDATPKTDPDMNQRLNMLEEQIKNYKLKEQLRNNLKNEEKKKVAIKKEEVSPPQPAPVPAPVPVPVPISKPINIPKREEVKPVKQLRVLRTGNKPLPFF